VHDYESTYPICGNGTVCQLNYNQPRGTVHICEGNGGVPGVPGDFSMVNCTEPDAPWCRVHGTGGAYGRITIFNATTLRYDHVQNNGGQITDSFVIFQPKHAPFTRV
jgi:hypothetical protein